MVGGQSFSNKRAGNSGPDDKHIRLHVAGQCAMWHASRRLAQPIRRPSSKIAMSCGQARCNHKMPSTMRNQLG